VAQQRFRVGGPAVAATPAALGGAAAQRDQTAVQVQQDLTLAAGPEGIRDPPRMGALGAGLAKLGRGARHVLGLKRHACRRGRLRLHTMPVLVDGHGVQHQLLFARRQAGRQQHTGQQTQAHRGVSAT